MLVLGIETSSPVGSVALVEDGRLLAQASHDTPNAHGEKLLGLIEGLFEGTGRRRQELSRVAVGRGPGSFTGLRIGLSIAQGIAIGLGIEAVGLGSLEAMALGLPPTSAALRCPVLDARRQELFWACYRDNGTCVVEPRTIPRNGLIDSLRAILPEAANGRLPLPTGSVVLLGAVTSDLRPEEFAPEQLSALGIAIYRSTKTDFPNAAAVALAACQARDFPPATPDYLRDADAIVPNLPPSPFPAGYS